MKKLVLSLLVATFALAGCGDTNKNNTEEGNSTEIESTASSTKMESTISSTKVVDSSEKQETQNPNLDENGVLINYPYSIDLEGATYNILSSKKLDGAMTGNPIIILEMEFTNKKQQPQSPYMSFITDFDAQQTDGKTTTTLMGANTEYGNLDDQEAVKMGDSNVNSGVTVKAIIGYTLQNKEQPVTFIYRPSQISGQNNGFIIK
ncbi:DUF5067 domain-containing protein [Enterococcus canintestini]|uniref:DUF5067 domain-containing protein n=1 Tax=Enterococcus canintestini TaxID=317010 RepID=A0A1L8R4K0_9ENTE|nr:DUF5067 domain-containing protein [Enterococcus canintestini]OJG14684.1 hypothetical protein RU96_GL000734 [Enterococcus canintestini]